MMRLRSVVTIVMLVAFFCPRAYAEDGYRLWLRYDRISDAEKLRVYRSAVSSLLVAGDSPTLEVVRDELVRGLEGLLDTTLAIVDTPRAGTVVAGTPEQSRLIAGLELDAALQQVGAEGYVLRTVQTRGRPSLVIAANDDIGVLYGAFHFLRLLQTHQEIDALGVVSAPKIDRRVLDHWDNLDRTVERGYAGFSLWDWHKLPDYLDPRYTDYARANASIGINGTVLTNVNANADVLTTRFLKKVAALADLFRPYGLQVYLTARFSAPVEIGGLDTADPLNPEVCTWWKRKVGEIYQYIPDFGGFLVKANSEGQPGPQDYGRSHAEGANMLAEALAPHDGIVMWRAFVYSSEVSVDRAKQAYNEFVPLDGQFRENVLVQVKYGPIDFQPREPFHPLFGAMPETPLMMELQITKEYLGQATHLVYLAPLWKEILGSDTYAEGEGSTVAKVVDGTLHGYELTGIAGVANTGTDRNWTGSHFNQANWYAFGRLAWDHTRSSEEIAETWIRMTFSNEADVEETIEGMMKVSHEAVVNYMTPLGLHHLMGTGHHYGPGPWVDNLSRAEWNPVYYHHADSAGIGFDRSSTGSNAVGQYFPPVTEVFDHRERIPEKYLLWFHHVPWDYEMESGRTLWEELVYRYNAGVDTVQWMQEQWATLEDEIDPARFAQVKAFLEIQEQEAVWWRDASLSYFQTFSNRPIPPPYPQPAHRLEYYKSLEFPYAPGI